MNRKFCGEVRHYWCESFDRRSGRRRVDAAAAAVRNWMKRLRNSTLSSRLIISVQDPGGGGWTLDDMLMELYVTSRKGLEATDWTGQGSEIGCL